MEPYSDGHILFLDLDGIYIAIQRLKKKKSFKLYASEHAFYILCTVYVIPSKQINDKQIKNSLCVHTQSTFSFLILIM